MNRKTIILAVIILLALITGSLYLNNAATHNTVTFSTTQTGIASITVTHIVSSTSIKPVATIDPAGKLSLTKGSYTAVAQGTNISTDPINFSVDSSPLTVTIHPGFSLSYLNQQLTLEQTAIGQAITSNLGQKLTGFKVNAGRLYKDGDWYTTTLIQTPAHPTENGDVYRMVMQKNNGQWKVIAPPAIVLSKQTYPMIPIDILRDINNQSGY
jgi:hypothetical protein